MLAAPMLRAAFLAARIPAPKVRPLAAKAFPVRIDRRPMLWASGMRQARHATCKLEYEYFSTYGI